MSSQRASVAGTHKIFHLSKVKPLLKVHFIFTYLRSNMGKVGQYSINHGVQRPCASSVTVVPIHLYGITHREKKKPSK